MVFNVGSWSFLDILFRMCLKFFPYCAGVPLNSWSFWLMLFLATCCCSIVASCVDILSVRLAPCFAVVG